MLTGIAESIELCRRSRVQGNWQHIVYSDNGLCQRWDPDQLITRKVKPSQPMKDPERYVRKPRKTKPRYQSHRNEPLLPPDGEDGVVAPWSTGGGVDEEVDGVVGDPLRGLLREHDVHVDGAEDLLERVEGQAAELALDEVGPVLHDGLELDVAVPGLPTWDEMEHVGAVGRLPFFAALCAGQGDAEDAKQREVCDLVPHAEEARVEVDLRGEGRDGEEAGGPHYQQGRDRLVEEAWVNVGRLLEDDDVPSGPLGGADLPEIEVCACAKCVRSGRASVIAE